MAENKDSAGKPQAEKEIKGEAPNAEAPKKGNPLVFWGIVAAIALLELPIMYGVIRLTQPKTPHESANKPGEDESKTETPTRMGQTAPPIEILTNVGDVENPRFVKVVAVLEYEDPQEAARKEKAGEGEGHGEGARKKGKLEEQLEARIPKFKDALIRIVASKTLTELNDPVARDRMREEFRSEVNKSLPYGIGSVTQVYFQEFIIQ